MRRPLGGPTPWGFQAQRLCFQSSFLQKCTPRETLAQVQEGCEALPSAWETCLPWAWPSPGCCLCVARMEVLVKMNQLHFGTKTICSSDSGQLGHPQPPSPVVALVGVYRNRGPGPLLIRDTPGGCKERRQLFVSESTTPGARELHSCWRADWLGHIPSWPPGLRGGGTGVLRCQARRRAGFALSRRVLRLAVRRPLLQQRTDASGLPTWPGAAPLPQGGR